MLQYGAEWSDGDKYRSDGVRFGSDGVWLGN